MSFLVALVTLIAPYSVAGLTPYQQFFSGNRQALDGLIHGNCSKPYNAYLQHIPASVTNPLLGYWRQDDPGHAVNNCLLSAAPETIKVNISSAQVILGLMPTILGILGPSSQELSLLLVLGNRQFLALALALGSPFASCDHSFDFAREIKCLPRLDDDRVSSVRFRWQAGVPFLYFQYLIVFAAIANIAELSYEFAAKASSVLIQRSPNYLPGVLAVAGFLMHLLVALAFQFCVKTEDGGTSGRSQRPAGELASFKRWTGKQLSAIAREDRPRHVELNTAKVSYTVTCWFAKMGIFSHVGFHTVAFSTTLFVSSGDAVALLFRYFGSVCICRMVAANEIAVLGLTVKRKAKTRTSYGSVRASRGGRGITYKRSNDEDGIPLASRGSG